jgi:hypothetical protein
MPYNKRVAWFRRILVLVLALAVVPAPRAMLAGKWPVDDRPPPGIPADRLPSAWHPARSPSALNVEFAGQLGGFARAVAVQGEYGYAGIGPRLAVLSLAAPPRTPVIVGQTAPLRDMIIDVTLNGNYAYVAHWHAGLSVIDISDPTAPILVGSYLARWSAWGVAVVGTIVYVADQSSGLHIFDVSNPAQPVELGVYPIYAWDVTVAAPYAYVAARYQGVYVLDISDPAQPVEVASFATSDDAQEVAVAGPYAYVADWDGGLRVVDVADPRRPVEIGHLTNWAAFSVAVAGRYAYVGAGTGGLQVVDISDPAHPREAGSYTLFQMNFLRVAVAGPYALAMDGDMALRVVNIANPAQPVETAFYAGPGHTWDVAVSGNYAYTSDYWYPGGGVHIVGLAGARRPVEVGYYLAGGVTAGVAVSGTYLYVAAWSNGLHIVDVSDPEQPRRVGSFMAGTAEDVAVQGNYAYMTADAGLDILDVSNPVLPVLVGTLPGPYGHIVLNGHYAYLAAGGLVIVDIADPAHPAVAGWYVSDKRNFMDVAVAGDYAYLVDYNGLLILDVSDPAHPLEAGAYAMPDAMAVAVAGTTAYLTSDQLVMLDVSDPAHPVEIGYDDSLPNWALSVVVSGPYVYIADYWGGLFVSWFVPPVAAVMTPGGGSFTSPFDRTTYFFPSGTFTATAVVTHQAHYPGNAPAGIGHVFDVTAAYSDTGRPALPARPYTITVQYDEVERGALIEDTLALYFWNGAQWAREPGSVVDPANNTVSATPGRFALWAVLGQAYQVLLPFVSRNW